MATKKTKLPKQASVIAVEARSKERLSDNDVMNESINQGWRFNNHPLKSRQFFENIKTGEIAMSIDILRSKLERDK